MSDEKDKLRLLRESIAETIEQLSKMPRLVRIESELAKHFPDAQSVNEALRWVVEFKRQSNNPN